MSQDIFEKSIDQTRLDKMRGEILSFVSEYESEGYNNMEIARALVWAAMRRANRDDLAVSGSFYHFLHDIAIQTIAREAEIRTRIWAEIEAAKIN